MSTDSAVFRALADDTRREILSLLSVSRRPVADLAAQFPGISRPAVSKHLRILRQAGLVSERRDGRRRLYQLETAALGSISRWLAEIEPHSVAAAGPLVKPRPKRPRGTAGLRPLRRDQPEDGDWRAW